MMLLQETSMKTRYSSRTSCSFLWPDPLCLRWKCRFREKGSTSLADNDNWKPFVDTLISKISFHFFGTCRRSIGRHRCLRRKSFCLLGCILLTNPDRRQIIHGLFHRWNDEVSSENSWWWTESSQMITLFFLKAFHRRDDPLRGVFFSIHKKTSVLCSS